MVWKIHPSHLRRVNELVKTLCSCYDRGNCILLDDGAPTNVCKSSVVRESTAVISKELYFPQIRNYMNKSKNTTN